VRANPRPQHLDRGPDRFLRTEPSPAPAGRIIDQGQ
jgi:hypothetical protein